MKIIETNICIGLGDIIYMKGQLDPFKHGFDQIKVTFDSQIIEEYRANAEYKKFLNDIGDLFFSEPPYILNSGTYPRRGQYGLCETYNLPMVKPNLKYILCKGALLNIDEEYIVMTTKHRFFTRSYWRSISTVFWNTIRRLSVKYKIVILGEKVVEKSKEYAAHGSEITYCIYDEIMNNLPNDRILDLTVPALGITAPNLEQIQQDCVIMSEAKFVLILGTGGAFCMATAVANTIGHRTDHDPLYEGKIYPDAFITRNFGGFIQKLESHL